MSGSRETAELFETLELTEYERQALESLLEVGRTTAPDLSEAAGIPKARVYGVLEELANAGYIEIIPGRPKEYQPKAPAEILDRAVDNRRQAFEEYRSEVETIREEFLATFEPLYERADEDVSPTEELFHVVDVGEPSERETRRLYRAADEQVLVFTKSFEYFDSVEAGVADALERGCEIRVLCLDPGLLAESNRPVQADTIARIRAEYPAIVVRFSATRLPWRGTLIDPSLEYESGRAVLLVEEEDIPLHKRQAAVTENASFVAGLGRYFELVWVHDTLETDPYRD